MVRFKYRYFAVSMEYSASSSFTLNCDDIKTTIRNKVQELHGDYGVGAIDPGLSVKYLERETKVFIVRAQHGPHRFVASIIPLVHSVDDTRVRWSIIYTGATIRQCLKRILKVNKQELVKFLNSASSKKQMKVGRLPFVKAEEKWKK